MNNGIKLIFTFALGAAAGSVVAWKLLETKYAQIAQEEIDSVKEVYSKKNDREDAPCETTETIEPEEQAEVIYKNIISEHYGDFEELKKGDSKPMNAKKPVVISPQEFNDIDETEYDIHSYTYFADEVLVDGYGEVVEDIEDTVGIEALTTFGEFEEDSVFVRNDDRMCVYEILLDTRNYMDLGKDVSNLTDNE